MGREIDECLLAALARGEARDALDALELGADANAVGFDGRSALRVACEDARADILVPALMKAGARLSPGNDGLDPLEACCIDSNWIGACALAYSPHIHLETRHVQQQDRFGSRLASGAAALGQLGVLRKIAELDPGIAEEEDAKGFDPFWHACESSSPRSAEFLCEMARADKTYPDGASRLHLASRLGSPRMVRSLLSRGARAGRRDAEGRLCMHHAAESGSLPIVFDLLEAGDPHDAPDNHGRTPLDIAKIMGKSDVEALLLALRDRDALQGDIGSDGEEGRGEEGGSSRSGRGKRL